MTPSKADVRLQPGSQQGPSAVTAWILLTIIFLAVQVGALFTPPLLDDVDASHAQAAQHMAENPYLHATLGHAQLWVTLVLLALLAAVFLRGFGEAIGLAVAVGIPYILLNGVVVARGFARIVSDSSNPSRTTPMIKNTVRRDRLGVAFAAASAAGADALVRDRGSVLGSIVVAMGSCSL